MLHVTHHNQKNLHEDLYNAVDQAMLLLLQATTSSSQPEAPYCDFAFRTGRDYIPLHRAILAARSKYFSKMLRTQWQPLVSIPDTVIL